MTWIAMTDFQEPAYWRRDADGQPLYELDDLLVKGSILIEAEYEPRHGEEFNILRFSNNRGWNRKLNISVSTGGDVRFVMQQGHITCQAVLKNAGISRGSRIRLHFNWNAPELEGELVLEDVEKESIQKATVPCPMPMPVSDIRNILTLRNGCEIGSDVTLFAMSDDWIKTGLAPTIAQGSFIDTEDGPRRIENLQLGDKVLTKDRGFQAIRWITSTEVPARGFYAPRTVRAPFFGLQQDITLAPHQRILMSGTTAEYLFGHDEVLAEVRHLKEHPSAQRKLGARTVRYYQIVLDSHECIRIAGLWCASAYIDPRSDFLGIPDCEQLLRISAGALPRHNECRPMLESFQTSTLLAATSK